MPGLGLNVGGLHFCMQKETYTKQQQNIFRSCAFTDRIAKPRPLFDFLLADKTQACDFLHDNQGKKQTNKNLVPELKFEDLHMT